MVEGHEMAKLLAAIVGKTPDERATMRRQLLDGEKVFVVYQDPTEPRGTVVVSLYDRSDVDIEGD